MTTLRYCTPAPPGELSVSVRGCTIHIKAVSCTLHYISHRPLQQSKICKLRLGPFSYCTWLDAAFRKKTAAQGRQWNYIRGSPGEVRKQDFLKQWLSLILHHLHVLEIPLSPNQMIIHFMCDQIRLDRHALSTTGPSVDHRCSTFSLLCQGFLLGHPGSVAECSATFFGQTPHDSTL